MRQWNSDKPHRCPGCHRVWVYQYQGKDIFKPVFWEIYTCPYCKVRFSGLGWEEADWRDFYPIFRTYIYFRNIRWKIDDYTAKIPRRIAYRLTQLSYRLYDPTFEQHISIRDSEGYLVKSWVIIADEWACGIDSSTGPDTLHGDFDITERDKYD